jgi:HSP20 family protein
MSHNISIVSLLRGGKKMAQDGKKGEKSIAVRKPAREMQELGQYFEDVFGRPFLPEAWGKLGWEEKVWAPSIDVTEQDDKYLVKAELPGVGEEDINISVSGNILTIDGEKEMSSEGKKDGYRYSESTYGSFSRSITIPSSVDVTKIEASSDKGVLEISLPKMPETKPKKIAISAKKKAAEKKKTEPPAKK